jgi:hypothetical protein
VNQYKAKGSGGLTAVGVIKDIKPIVTINDTGQPCEIVAKRTEPEDQRRKYGNGNSYLDHATAARSSLSAPRMTILTASSGNGRCSAFASSHGARIHASRSSSVLTITGLPTSSLNGFGRLICQAVPSRLDLSVACTMPSGPCFCGRFGILRDIIPNYGAGDPPH